VNTVEVSWGQTRPLLNVEGLSISHGAVPIATSLNIVVERGQTVAIIGESGSGKSPTARAIAGILPRGIGATGDVVLDGISLMRLAESELRKIRGFRVSMVMQDPFTC
jgi:peptide/nickel transport system ATP-binding protein